MRHGHEEVAKAITAKEPQTLRLPNKAAGVLMCTHGTSGSVSPPLGRSLSLPLSSARSLSQFLSSTLEREAESRSHGTSASVLILSHTRFSPLAQKRLPPRSHRRCGCRTRLLACVLALSMEERRFYCTKYPPHDRERYHESRKSSRDTYPEL